MASTVLCTIVSAEQEIYSGQVEMVVATGTIGAVSYTHLTLPTILRV